MRHQQHYYSASSTPVIVDEEEGVPAHLVDEARNDSPLGRSLPFSTDLKSIYLRSMSDFDKTQSYDVYDYQQSTRPEQAQDYTTFAPTHPQYTHDFVGTQAQPTSTLTHAHAPALPYLASGQVYAGSADQSHFYAAAADAQHFPSTTPASDSSAFLEPAGPRQLPAVLSYTPAHGIAGTKVSISIQSQIDLLRYPQNTISIMFAHKRCDSVVSRDSQSTSPYQYLIDAQAPAFSALASQSPQVNLAIALDGPVAWPAPTLDVGTFTYSTLATQSPSSTRKRKLSVEASERRSPVKKPSSQQLSRSVSQKFYPDSANMMSQAVTRPAAQTYAQPRRFSQPDYQYGLDLPRVQTQHYYAPQPASASARMQSEIGSAYDYQSASLRTPQVLPTSASPNPPLIRTSTLHQPPSAPSLPIPPPQGFNPYAMYPANTKAMLKLEGDLNSMADQWTDVEWETKRRLVQFQRNQSGSVISTTFEPVTLEQKAPNSICVSCIYWEEKRECYVTSVDTIQLLESLVAVRFTVEEKNRIRRNLEGFRPATVSKTKADSEDFFKLIMGFPNPKPRNIEKDVKVFPWRILATALKKIIGKYSASYSSTAGALHGPAASSYAASSMDTRLLASPRSTSSSTTSQQHSYVTANMATQSYMPQHTTVAAMDLSAGPPGLRLSVPQSGSSWQSSGHYASAQPDLTSTASTARTPSWDYASSLTGYGMTGAIPGASSQYHYGAAQPSSSLLGHQQILGQRFIPMPEYEQHPQGQPTTSGA